MAFNNPEAFYLLLAVPILMVIWGLTALYIRKESARFANPTLFPLLTRSLSRSKRGIRGLLFLMGLIFLALALTEPRFGTKTEIVSRMGVDIVIALDTSYSMLAEDIKPNRIGQAKYEISRLIDSLEGDRIALLAFAGKAFVQCPLTTDYGAAKTLLETLDVGSIPVPGTNIGEALESSMRLLEKGSTASGESQLIIMFTDGENLEGDYERAAKKAGSHDIRIFTIGIGTTAGEIIPIRGDSGTIEDYKKDDKGNIVKTALDEKTLDMIARSTNGAYLHTKSGDVDIQTIIDQLGSMHKTDIHERKISRLRERYQLPLGVSLFFLLAWMLIFERRSGVTIERYREG